MLWRTLLNLWFNIFTMYRWCCSSSSSGSSDFWLTCRCRGNIHISGTPSRKLACCMHGRSHTRSPGMSIIRVDSPKLPLCNSSLSAAAMSSWASQDNAFHQPVCQKLSWLHHWSVPHAHTSWVCLLEWGRDPQCQSSQVANWIWWWQCIAAWLCRSVWSLPCYFAADVGALVLSIAKSHWHGELQSAHELYTWSCTRGHASWKRVGWKRTGSSSLNFQAVFTHVIESSQPSAAESMSPR